MAVYELIPKLVRAAYAEDWKTVESVSIMLGRKLRKESPEVSAQILQIAADHKVGGDIYRSIDLAPVPVDEETRNQLVDINENTTQVPPVLQENVMDQMKDFLMERSLVEDFLQRGVTPPNSLLMYGKPGVGKTYSAKWLAGQLGLPLITVDLAYTISSYLGRSGQNIKKIFDYAKKQSCVLFLDEFDAIAKKRDDESDLGELKRLVNVLLKEMEDCPVSCIIIGATNHPELLDSAIWRRFDRSIEIPLPEIEERNKLLDFHLSGWVEDPSTKNCLLRLTDGMSAADICRLCNHIKRQIVMNPTKDKGILTLREICRERPLKSRDEKVDVCRNIKKMNPTYTVRMISDITSVPVTSVSRYIKETANG